MSKIKDITTEIVLNGRKKNQCYIHPCMAVAPAGVFSENPMVMFGITQQTASDMGPMHYSYTTDLGKTWAPIFETENIYGIPLEDDIFEIPWLYPFYHRKTKTMMALGFTMFHRDSSDPSDYNRFKFEWFVFGIKQSMGFAIWDHQKRDFNDWQKIPEPDNFPRVRLFINSWHEESDGTILIPYYTETTESEDTEHEGIPGVGVIKFGFDGEKFKILEVGAEVRIEKKYGICEPCIAKFKSKYYMTIRSEIFEKNYEGHDQKMYWSVSDDGINFSKPKNWCWDDGSNVETENTMQYLIGHKDTLFLIYTRINDLCQKRVFRSRAPLFIAAVDVSKNCLIKETERVIFPEHDGARMGNFNAKNVLEDEIWVMDAEWVQCQDHQKKEGERFWSRGVNNGVHYNKIQYIGDVLLAKVKF